MELRKVLSNRDPLKMGRILVEDERWLSPIAAFEEIWVPEEGTFVVEVGDYYLGSKLEE